MSRHVEGEFYNRYATYWRGPAVRSALITLTGKVPCYSHERKAWVCSERTARERLLPYLESLGLDIVITGPRAAASAPVVVENLEREPELW